MTKNKTRQPILREGVGRYDTFCVTHEVLTPIGKGNLLCLSTGEIVDAKAFKKKLKGTWLKVTHEPIY